MFFSILQNIAEQRILDAQKSGEFDNLPGMGKPLELKDDRDIPPELRLPFTILKNSGHIPAELQERKSINTLMDILDNCADEKQMVKQMQKIRFRILQAKIRKNRNIALEDNDPYFETIMNRLMEHERRLSDRCKNQN